MCNSHGPRAFGYIVVVVGVITIIIIIIINTPGRNDNLTVPAEISLEIV